MLIANQDRQWWIEVFNLHKTYPVLELQFLR